MLAKERRLFEQQQLLLQAVLQVLTAPFVAHAADAAALTAGDGGTALSEYRPGVPPEAWRGLQLACYVSNRLLRLWEGGSAAAALAAAAAAGAAGDGGGSSAVRGAVQGLRQQLQDWEFELVQRHVWYSFNRGLGHCLVPRDAAAVAAQQRAFVEQHRGEAGLVLPTLPTDSSRRGGSKSAAAAAADGSSSGAAAAPGPGCYPLSEILMADWVTLNVQHPELNAEQLMEGAAAVYSQYGLEAPLGSADTGEQLPAREMNPLDPASLAAVGVSGEGVQAAGWAQVPVVAASAAAAAAAAAGGGGGGGGGSAGRGLPWPRCSAGLQLCQPDSGSPPWGCSSCGRRYQALPCRVLPAPGAVPDKQQQGAAAGGCGVPCAPLCVVCGLRLSPGGAAAAGIAGCSRLPQGVLDGSPALAVGASLSDVVLD
jgi:hypothetical protein